ncbi:hypothetical protein KSX_29540 [Ktedonospora formicarum]|uniref:Uncharacterized protein n=1 Tax=Ktedonospora formicarum TaxID=2778364 RepID=A0A8J3HZE2_9CHLR|nr:hypothetical protein KSX_29540 [Ktedonospora formicarum]
MSPRIPISGNSLFLHRLISRESVGAVHSSVFSTFAILLFPTVTKPSLRVTIQYLQMYIDQNMELCIVIQPTTRLSEGSAYAAING